MAHHLINKASQLEKPYFILVDFRMMIFYQIGLDTVIKIIQNQIFKAFFFSPSRKLSGLKSGKFFENFIKINFPNPKGSSFEVCFK